MSTATGPSPAQWRRRLRALAPSLSRDLPWTQCGSPWAVLVSEIMLQQTQVARVIPAWERFLSRFPTPSACAIAPLDEVIRLWEGLGYHRRAVNLHRAANAIVVDYGGEVPSEVDALSHLPGVGAYTARAVASFAFGVPVGVLDTNVGRVLARAVVGRSLARAEAQALADEVAGAKDSAVLNQALLDLGAQYCTARPRCSSCPVRRTCCWAGEGDDPATASAAVSRAQPRFEGSRRQRRGQLLAAMCDRPLTLDHATSLVGSEAHDILQDLIRDHLVTQRAGRFRLATTSG